MPLELLPPVENTGTLTDLALLIDFLATPGFHLVVLCVFVPFPVILAPEFFVASREGAAIRTRVTFLMLPIHVVSHPVRDAHKHIEISPTSCRIGEPSSPRIDHTRSAFSCTETRPLPRKWAEQVVSLTGLGSGQEIHIAG